MRRQIPGSHKPSRLFRESEQELARERARWRLRSRLYPAEDTRTEDEPAPAQYPIGDRHPVPAPDMPAHNPANGPENTQRQIGLSPHCQYGSDKACEHQPRDTSPGSSSSETHQEARSDSQSGQECDQISGGKRSETTQVADGHVTYVAGTRDTASTFMFGELATAYVPWQMFNQTLSLSEALMLGTLFPELVRHVPLYQKPPGT